MIYIGIDPGANGGIVVINAIRLDDVLVGAFPFKFIGMYTLSSMLDDLSEYECFALIESVHSMPGQGVVSSFTFGHQFGMLEGLLIGSGIPYDRVTPQKWQKEFDLYKQPGETKTDKKNRHKALAQDLFPDIKVTHATADALLIAKYCEITHGR